MADREKFDQFERRRSLTTKSPGRRSSPRVGDGLRPLSAPAARSRAGYASGLASTAKKPNGKRSIPIKRKDTLSGYAQRVKSLQDVFSRDDDDDEIEDDQPNQEEFDETLLALNPNKNPGRRRRIASGSGAPSGGRRRESAPPTHTVNLCDSEPSPEQQAPLSRVSPALVSPARVQDRDRRSRQKQGNQQTRNAQQQQSPWEQGGTAGLVTPFLRPNAQHAQARNLSERQPQRGYSRKRPTRQETPRLELPDSQPSQSQLSEDDFEKERPRPKRRKGQHKKTLGSSDSESDEYKPPGQVSEKLQVVGGANDHPIELLDTQTEPDDSQPQRVTRSQMQRKKARQDYQARTLFSYPFSAPNDNDAATGSVFRGQIRIAADDVDTLDPHEFLNDSIIEFRLRWLSDEYDLGGEKYHVFNSFFFRALQEHGYEKVKKWTKHTDIFAKKAIFVPIHEASHWRLVVIVNAATGQPRMLSMDSLSLCEHRESFRTLCTYLKKEWRDKKREEKEFETPEWEQLDVPQQENGSDCGVFMLHYVECWMRDDINPDDYDKWDTMFNRSEITSDQRRVLKRGIEEVQEKYQQFLLTTGSDRDDRDSVVAPVSANDGNKVISDSARRSASDQYEDNDVSDALSNIDRGNSGGGAREAKKKRILYRCPAHSDSSSSSSLECD